MIYVANLAEVLEFDLSISDTPRLTGRTKQCRSDVRMRNRARIPFPAAGGSAQAYSCVRYPCLDHTLFIDLRTQMDDIMGSTFRIVMDATSPVCVSVRQLFDHNGQ